MKLQKGARILQKRTELPSIIPTIPTSDDHTTGWLETDIYKGELFFNLADIKAWTRMNTGITEFAMLDPNTNKIKLGDLPPAVLGSVRYQGTWNANLGTPPIVIPSGHEIDYKGYYYIVSTSGTTNLSGINIWHVQDWAIYDGVSWGKVDNYEAATSTNVSYSNTAYPTLTNVKLALDYLLYVPPQITLFNISPAMVDNGRAILQNEISINWAVNKSMIYIGIDDFDYYHSGNLVPATSGVINNPNIPNFEPISTDYYFIIDVMDNQTTINQTSWIRFLNRAYWGVGNSSLTNAQIIGLNSVLTNTKSRTITLTTSSNYWYYCIPTGFGTPIFTISGLEVVPQVTTVTLTNSYGFSTSYNIYRSSNSLTGTITIIIT